MTDDIWEYRTFGINSSDLYLYLCLHYEHVVPKWQMIYESTEHLGSTHLTYIYIYVYIMNMLSLSDRWYMRVQNIWDQLIWPIFIFMFTLWTCCPKWQMIYESTEHLGSTHLTYIYIYVYIMNMLSLSDRWYMRVQNIWDQLIWPIFIFMFALWTCCL